MILLLISPVHKVVSCRARPLEESTWMVHVSERAARLPKGHNIAALVLSRACKNYHILSIINSMWSVRFY